MSNGTSPGGLPINQGGTTYVMTQAASWLDQSNFAVGRWDGSMSIFQYMDGPSTGPAMQAAVRVPAGQGVQMVSPVPAAAIVTSNDSNSLVVWGSGTGSWSGVGPLGTYVYDPSLGVANSGLWTPVGSPTTFIAGHESGFISLWHYDPQSRKLKFERDIDLRNPEPVNPWNLHNIRGIELVAVLDGGVAVIATGSEDGYICLVQVPTGKILDQSVFNPLAQRGINSIAVTNWLLLAANCMVGQNDFNLWYYSITANPWGIKLLDRARLMVDQQADQVFNFSTVWGAYSGGSCWFSSTQEGALWQGQADSDLSVIGYQLLTPALGAALGYRSQPGRLFAASYDLYQFTTGATG